MQQAGSGPSTQAGVLAATATFAADEGRRPRVLVTAPGPHGGDPDSVVTAFAGFGFDVDVAPAVTESVSESVATVAAVARQAVDNDVHLVWVTHPGTADDSILSTLQAALTEQGRPDIRTACGSAVRPADVLALLPDLRAHHD